MARGTPIVRRRQGTAKTSALAAVAAFVAAALLTAANVTAGATGSAVDKPVRADGTTPLAMAVF
ncbi:MAG: hypothetical protein ABI859_20635, partial [Pseudomonadota bacterium]